MRLAKAPEQSRRSAKPSETTSISAIDAHGRLTTTMAVDFCTRIEDLRPMFVEEATQLEDVDELAYLRSKTKVPLATGERSFTKYGFSEFCTRHLVDYIQPDVCHAGGILELKKIGSMAETFESRWRRIIRKASSAPSHPSMSTPPLPASTIQEYAPEKPAWVEDLFEGTALRVNNGFAELPEKPGLGCTLNEKVAAAHPYKPVTRPHYVFSDGAVADQ